MSSPRFVAIDEEGYFAFDGRRVDDAELGRRLLDSVKLTDTFALTCTLDQQTAFVEAFDAPLIAKHLRLVNEREAEMDLAYGAMAQFLWSDLSVDEWDRFHGLSMNGVPFVLSRQAQVELFDLVDEFDDDSITVRGHRYNISPWLRAKDDVVRSDFWTQIYRNEKPGWELGRETPILNDVMAQIKLAKARVLVLGCGSGHDAAFFARQGHMVTAVDFSEEAFARAQSQYGDVDNLTFQRLDALALPENWSAKFDLVFEHTLYCAIAPEKRNQLVRTWRRVLNDHGHLLGVFFVKERLQGPPWGGSEWEVRKRLETGFQALYWTRWRRSLERRQGTELVVYARKRT